MIEPSERETPRDYFIHIETVVLEQPHEFLTPVALHVSGPFIARIPLIRIQGHTGNAGSTGTQHPAKLSHRRHVTALVLGDMLENLARNAAVKAFVLERQLRHRTLLYGEPALLAEARYFGV